MRRGKAPQMPRGMELGRTPTLENAKWGGEKHELFVKLCVAEVLKGNRPNTTLNKEGWMFVYNEFTRQTKKKYEIKQLKNHWDAMKANYKLFKKLKFGYSGLGWNEMTRTFEEPEDWWNERLQENSKYSKFRNTDLSLYVNYYDTLFGDVVASGERARAANTYSAVDLEVGEDLTDFGDDDGKEGSGDSDDNNLQSPPSQNMFPSTSFKSGMSSGSKRKKSGADVVREGLDGLVAAMSCRSTATTAATEDLTLNEAIMLIDSMPEFDAGSDLYFFAQRYILHPGNRTLFLKARNNELRFGQIMYNFKHFKGAGN